MFSSSYNHGHPQTNYNGLLNGLLQFANQRLLLSCAFQSSLCSSTSLLLLVCKLLLALPFTPSPCLQTAPRFTIHFYTQLFTDAVDKGVLPMSKIQPSFHQRFLAESSSLFSFLQLFQQPTTTAN